MKLPSKRLMTRLAVLSVVVVLGGIAVSKAHFAIKKSAAGKTPATDANKDAVAQKAVAAIPDTQADADAPPRANPFIGSRLLPASHTVEESGAPARSPAADAAYRPLPPPARGGEVAPTTFSTAVVAAAIGDTPSPAPAAEGTEASVVVPPRDSAPGYAYPDYDGPAVPRPAAGAAGAAAATAAAAAERSGAFGSQNMLRSRNPATETAPYNDTDRLPSRMTDANSSFPAPVRMTDEPPAGVTDSPTPGYAPVDASPRTSIPPVRPPMDSRFGGAAALPVGAAPYAGAVIPARRPASVATLPTASENRIGNDTARTPASAEEGTGTPGEAILDGPQNPAIVMQKAAPTEIQVGKPAKFAVKIRNTGQATATDLVVRDEVPKGTKLIDTSPSAARIEGSQIVWELGSLEPNQETLVTMQVMPLSEGEVGSVATVTFNTQASVRTRCTKPELVLEHTAPRRVLSGSPVAFTIKLSNPGSGSTTGVTLEATVPKGLSHPAGAELEFEVGTLAPGETRELELTLNATEAGLVESLLIARADANLVSESRATMEVIAPQLAVSLKGPSRRYLERPGTYEVTVSNPGTAPAKDVELVATLPPGMKFQETNNAGVYDAERHSVFWSVAELPADGGGTVELVVMPLEAGEQKISVEGRAETGLVDMAEQTVAVEGLASLYFEVNDSADPIEVGEDTLYEIRVLNEGSKTAENVRVVATLPNTMKPLSGEGATPATVQGQLVQFGPLARLAPKADVTYQVRAQGLEAGYQRISVQIQSDDMEHPVTREESTRVYSDQ
jgi:uncharacterized repeat protein (TIGR01451 family)